MDVGEQDCTPAANIVLNHHLAKLCFVVHIILYTVFSFVNVTIYIQWNL